MACKHIYKGITYNSKEEFMEKVINPQLKTLVKENNISVSEIYNKLGNKTKEGNVVIQSVYQTAGVQYAKSIGGIFSLRVNGTNNQFGNPFSSVESEIQKGLIRTKSTKESVEKYIEWVLSSTTTIKPEQHKFIREWLQSGKLKNKPIVYYKELNEPSHATALDYLINKYDWSKKQDTSNQFLQLLNKDNNWVTFFVKSIIQDSAKQTITEVQESDVEAKVKELEKEGLLEIDCSKIKAKDGIRSKFTKGSRWEIVKDLKGYPFHAQGGVDIKLGKDGFSFNSNGNDIKAAHGLVLPKIK